VLNRFWFEQNQQVSVKDDTDPTSDSEDEDIDTQSFVLGNGVKKIPDNWMPQEWWAFMLYGPYGAATYGLTICQLLKDDDSKIGKADGRKAFRKEASQLEDLKRQEDNFRGKSSVNEVTMSLQQAVVNRQDYDSKVMTIKEAIVTGDGLFEKARFLYLECGLPARGQPELILMP
jgi:hypothetical protein